MARDEDDERPAEDADRLRTPPQPPEQGARAADRRSGQRADSDRARQHDTQQRQQPQQGGSQHPLTEEEAERLRERVPLDRDAEPGELEGAAAGGEDEEGLTVFTKDQLIHEAAVHARNYYGKTRLNTEDAEKYGERDPEKGYYDLVDAWILAAQIMDDEYHEDFLRLSMPFHWSWRSNRHLIPNYYIIAQKGITEALRDDYIQPPFYHKLEYNFLAKFPPVTPPLAWYLKDRDKLHERAKLLSGEETPSKDYKSMMKSIEIKVETLAEKAQDAADAGDTAEVNRIKNRIQELEDEYNRLEQKIKTTGGP